MFPGINPRQMKQAMKKMGLQQSELDVVQVIFKMRDKDIIVDNPSVSKINMMGQETFQVTGEIREQEADSTPDISDEDIQTIIDQVECTEKTAKDALEETKGDLALAIMNLKN